MSNRVRGGDVGNISGGKVGGGMGGHGGDAGAPASKGDGKMGNMQPTVAEKLKTMWQERTTSASSTLRSVLTRQRWRDACSSVLACQWPGYLLGGRHCIRPSADALLLSELRTSLPAAVQEVIHI